MSFLKTKPPSALVLNLFLSYYLYVCNTAVALKPIASAGFAKTHGKTFKLPAFKNMF